MPRPLLVLEGVNKWFGGLHVLKDISFAVSPGEVISIIGPSGSGKSTLLRCINLLEDVHKGRLELRGELIGYRQVGDRLVKRSEREQAQVRSRMGMVFQRFNLFPHLTVLRNCMEAPMQVRKLSQRDAEEKARGLLVKVGLADKADSYPMELSGGQQQRVAIARALAMDPEIMLFDEPTSALDPELVGEVLEVIRHLVEEGMTTLIVSHEMRFVRDIATRVLFLDGGVILESGAPDQIFGSPQNERTRKFLSAIRSA